jgi:hypothetical protein
MERNLKFNKKKEKRERKEKREGKKRKKRRNKNTCPANRTMVCFLIAMLALVQVSTKCLVLQQYH